MASLAPGDKGTSLFRDALLNIGERPKLITDQMDHSLPQAAGMARVSDPLLPTENIAQALRLFDPEIYDTRLTSHIVRFISALTGSSGVGGIRKQLTVSRMAASVANANFFDLDTFYGAIFNFKRYNIEGIPTVNGSTLNPLTDVATPDVWDDARSRDARFRSRIRQLVQAINMGGTHVGIKAVAEAVLSCEVDLVESWILKTPAYVAPPNPATAALYSYISNQFVYYGAFNGQYYGKTSNVVFGSGYMPGDNVAEIVLTPRRAITKEENIQLSKVLAILRPTHTHITISQAVNETTKEVKARSLFADSEDWDVVVRVTPANNLSQSDNVLYAGGDEFTTARPLFSEFSGESWSYNPSIVRTYSYQISEGTTIFGSTEEEITYQDGTSHLYKAVDAIMDKRQASSLRLSGDGVVTAYPYAGNRQIVASSGSTE